ncbi:MAG: hypothetical protein K2X91_13590, partial [Thermoleophilia bacterium]|nr:hypothetical protein [Thermoleophilia bacterium]
MEAFAMVTAIEHTRGKQRVGRGLLAVAALACLASAPIAARGAGPADPLLELVPPDAALTLAVTGLKEQAREIAGSAVFAGFRRLPAVRRWLEGGEAGTLRAGIRRLERVLGADAATLRDGLLGESVVLSLSVPAGQAPDQARGLVLTRVADPALLDRLIDGVNSSQRRGGELARLVDRSHAGVGYMVREFRPGGRPLEFYVKLPGRVFAWSNSEDLIRGVIERQASDAPGLADDAAFREVREGLPDRPVAELHADPKFLRTVLAASPAETPDDRRSQALLVRYLEAVRRIGLALTWRGGPALHLEERLDPEKVPAPLRRWAGLAAGNDPIPLRVPATAVALAVAQIDADAALDGLIALSGVEPASLDALWTAGRGMLMGLDPRTQVLPFVGPLVSAYVER